MPAINQSREYTTSARAGSRAGRTKSASTTGRTKAAPWAFLCTATRWVALTVALWGTPWVTAWVVLPSILALAAPESIQIIRPLATSQEVFLENDDSLLIVPGGRMLMFEVEISALNPLLEVRINGRMHSSPRTTWTFIKLPQFLKRGKNRILVEARTRSGRARQEFIIELRGLPGFGPRSFRSSSSPMAS